MKSYYMSRDTGISRAARLLLMLLASSEFDSFISFRFSNSSSGLRRFISSCFGLFWSSKTEVWSFFLADSALNCCLKHSLNEINKCKCFLFLFD